MQDVTSYRSLWFYLWTLAAAKKHGCPVVMYGCGIGPINNPGNRRRTARVINRYVDAITLRDPDSMGELEDLGIDQPKIERGLSAIGSDFQHIVRLAAYTAAAHGVGPGGDILKISLSADTTVILPAAPEEVVDGIMNNCGIPVDGRYIGFILRPWFHFEEKVRTIAAAADYAYQTYGLTPLFVPIEPRLDVPASQQVARHMTAPYYMVRDGFTASETIGLLSRLEIAVSMRLHGLIFSAGQAVPSVGIVYDQKVSSFLDYIGQHLHEDLPALTVGRLTALIDSAAAQRDDRNFLAQQIEKLREMEEVNRRVIADYIRKERSEEP